MYGDRDEGRRWCPRRSASPPSRHEAPALTNPHETAERAAGLVSAASHAFTTRSRSRGREYFARGAVRIEGADAQTVVASVTGSRPKPYVCAIDFSQVETRERLRVECTCPNFFEGHKCKHLFASLLAIDSAGIELVPAASLDRRLDVVSYEAHLAAEDDWFFTGEHAPPIEKTGGPPPWERKLAALRRSSGDWRRRSTVEIAIERSRVRSIRYRLLIAQSASVQGLVVGAYEEVSDEEVPVPVALSMREIPAFTNEEDRRLLSMLAATPMPTAVGYEPGIVGRGDDVPTKSLVPPGYHEEVLRALVATKRFDVFVDGATAPMTFDERTQYDVRARVRVDGDEATLDGEIVAGDEVRSVRDVRLFLATGLCVVDTRVARWGPLSAYDFVRQIAATEPITFAPDEMAQFLDGLLDVANLPPLVLPEPWKSQLGEPAPQVSFLEPDRRGGVTRGLVGFDYGRARFDASDGTSGWVDAENHTIVRRDLERERTALERLGRIGVAAAAGFEDHQIELDTRALPRAARGLLGAGWGVEAKGQRLVAMTGSSVRLESGTDWFELSGEIHFGDQVVELPELLRAIRDRDGFIKLGDGREGMLPEDWLVRFGALDKLGAKKKNKLRFASSQALLLDLLIAERETEVDEKFSDLRRRLRSTTGFRTRHEARSFIGELREYQRDGLGWMYFLQRTGLGGCLADDMGLGKTVQVLALLEARRRLRRRTGRPGYPSLVVAPRSLVHNWLAEARRFTPELVIADYTGPERWRVRDEIDRYDLIVTTYGTVRRDIERLKEQRFDYAVLDEAQAIKNASSLASKASRLLQADHRLALSGTPIENHLLELWSIFEFLNPKMLGSRREFGRLVKEEDGRGLEIVARGLRPMILRRTKDQVLEELPAKTEQTIYIEPDEDERRLYGELATHYKKTLLSRVRSEGLDRSRMHVLEALLRLRQAACHPGLLDETRRKEDSAKLTTLVEHLEEVTAEGHKALVFSQFVQLLQITKKRLDKAKIPYAYLDGSTTKRAEVIDKFQNDPQIEVFLISLKAGGFGLNLTAADYVFILDPWWNPAVEAQAIDRAHRIGQTKPVFAYRLITAGTVEEKILALHSKKRALADSVVGDANHLSGELTLEDLELLLT